MTVTSPAVRSRATSPTEPLEPNRPLRPSTGTHPATVVGADGEAHRLVVENLGLARALAHRFRGRGPETEDLEQVACLGLVKAVRGYDPARGDLAPYATATILGELRRHFRDAGWVVRPPRRVQELQVHLHEAERDLTQRAGVPPTDAELADRLDAQVRDVREARSAVGCWAPRSLDGTGDDPPLHETLPVPDDDALERVDEVASLRPLRTLLTEDDRELLRMRFVEELTQQQIADAVGVSQMQVSRRLGRVLRRLGQAARADPPPQEGAVSGDAAARRRPRAPHPTGRAA